jgi:hypothetical protein
MLRYVLPSLFAMTAARTDWAAQWRLWFDLTANDPAARKQLGPIPWGPAVSSVQLRWMSNSLIGLPRHGFVVYHRPSRIPPLVPITARTGQVFAGLPLVLNFATTQAIVAVDFTNTGTTPYSLIGYARQGQIVAYATGSNAGASTITIAGSGMDSALLFAAGTVTAVRGISDDDFANLPDWSRVELVGLPYDEAAFAGSGYSDSPQGLVSAPVAPVPAALRRLKAGAPLIGWSPLIGSSGVAPAWQAPDPTLLVSELQKRLLGIVRQMLATSSAPVLDAAVKLTQTLKPPSQVGGTLETKESSSSADLPALGLLLLNASADAFNALALGYGTAYLPADIANFPTTPAGTGDDTVGSFLVECPVTIGPFDVTLADFVVQVPTPSPPAAPAFTAAWLEHINRPHNKAAPCTAAFAVAWPRISQIAVPIPRVASYGLVRGVGPIYQEVLDQRPGGGPSSFVPTRDQNDPDWVTFNDGDVPPPSSGTTYDYAVAAQDLFGLWSPWTVTSVSFPAQPVVVPKLGAGTFAASPNPSGLSAATLTVDVTWDWTDREPQTIDLMISLYRPTDVTSPLPSPSAPAGVQFSLGGAVGAALTLNFAGGSMPTVNLGASVTLVPPMPPPAPPPNTALADVRTYRVVIPNFSLDFAGNQQVVAFVWTQGAQRITPFTMVQSPDRRALIAQNPNPPMAPALGGPLFSSLPDHVGVARAHISWSGGGPQWAVYEATETAVLVASGLPPPDVKASLVGRLATVHGLDMTTIKGAFRRITASPLNVPETEVELPRGTAVMHLYAVRSVGGNNLESAFPTATTSLIAVAVPHLRVPPEPALRADLVTSGAKQVARLRVTSRRGLDVARFDLHRTAREALSRDIDMTGPPIARSDGAGWTVVTNPDGTVTAEYVDSSLVPSWDTVFYRAAAWGVEDTLEGYRAGRSGGSSAGTVVLPPPNASSVSGLAVQQTTPLGAIVAFQVGAPAAPTSIGSHVLSVQVRDPVQNSATTFRSDLPLERLRFFKTFAAGVAATQPGRAFRYPGVGATLNVAVYLPHPTRSPSSNKPYRVVVTLVDPLNRASTASMSVNW